MNFAAVDVTNAYQDTNTRQIYFSFCVGMAINLTAIYIGNPYLVTLLVIPIALVATAKWLRQPLAWITLVSVVAANPVNLNASVALNLIFAFFLLIFRLNYISRLPTWLHLTLIFSIISMTGSAVSWGETGGVFTQLAAASNYVIGPFLLLPLIYVRLQNEPDKDTLLKILIISLIVPTIVLMLLARLFGTPMIYENSLKFDYLVNVSIYHFGNVDFQLTRTQAGFPLAVTICASFAVIIGSANKYFRSICLVALLIGVFLLLVTGSIGSSLTALCGLVLILGVAKRYVSIKKYIILIPFVVVLFVVGWSQVPTGIKDYAASRIEEKLTGGINISDRSHRWLASLEYLTENPLGRGWELWVESLGTYPHNDYISYGIAYGFIVCIIYLYLPIKIFFTINANKINTNSQSCVALYLVVVGAIVVLLFNSMGDHLSANRWYFNMVWSIVWYGYFACQTQAKK